MPPAKVKSTEVGTGELRSTKSDSTEVVISDGVTAQVERAGRPLFGRVRPRKSRLPQQDAQQEHSGRDRCYRDGPPLPPVVIQIAGHEDQRRN
jgi:hypothetical protein